MTPVQGLIGLNVAFILVIAWLVLRRSQGSPTAMVNQQLVELRGRLDALTAAHAAIPRVLAEARADQTTDLSDQLTTFAQMVSGQIDAGRDTVNRQLAESGELMVDVRERLGELSSSAKRMEEIGSDVARVDGLLRVPQLRGGVGEAWLEEMLHQMIPAEFIERQYSFRTGERVDCVVRLGDKLLPIDAKFPLDACQRMLAENGDAEQSRRHRRAFEKSVRVRIDEVAHKYIRPSEGTFDFAVMYVPAERVYHEVVVSEGGELMSYALARRVVLASPNSLYAYLATLTHGLRAFNVEQHARAVADAMGELHVAVGQLMRTHDTMGRHVENAVKQHAELGRVAQRIQRQLEGLPGHIPPVRGSRPFSGV